MWRVNKFLGVGNINFCMIHFVKLMIECPKCGFYQPEDRYCANCGVDIVNYRKKPTKLYKKVLNNPWTYFVLLLVITLTLILYITTQPQSQLAKTAKNWILAPEDNESPTSLESAYESQPLAASTDLSTDTQKEAISNNENPLANESPPAPAVEKPQDVPPPPSPTTLVVTFIEFSRAAMDGLYKQSQILTETPEMQVLNLKKDSPLSYLKEIDGQLDILPGGGESPLGENPKIYSYIYSDESAEEYGLSFQIQAKEASKQNLSLEYDIFLNLKGTENKPDPVTQNFEGSYQIPINTALVLSGILPKQKLPQEALSILSSTPLKIMENPEFHATEGPSLSEFLILLSYK